MAPRGDCFGSGVGADSKHPLVNIVEFRQGGTSLADRDYYLKSDPRTKKIQDAYTKYVTGLFTLAGATPDQAVKNAATIFTIETALAKAQMSRVAMRDPNATYNKFVVTDFDKITPHLNWSALMPVVKLNGQDTVLVAALRFL